MKMKVIIPIYFLIVFFSVTNSYAQWKVYTEEVQSGLIKGGNDTEVACEDKSGNVWVTTRRGDIFKFKDEKWTRYDIERIKMFSITDFKKGNYVRWVTALDKKNPNWVWFASNKTTLLWNGSDFLVLTGILDDDKRMIFYSEENKKNYIIKENQLQEYNASKLVKAEKPVIQIHSIYVDSKNRLWLGHWKGELYCLEDGKWKVFDDIKNLKGQKGSPKGVYQINLITEDAKGVMWICVNNCIVKYDGNKFSIEQVVRGAKSAFLDSKNNLWIGYHGGIFKYKDGEWEQFQNKAGMEDVPQAGRIFEDKNGNIWYCAKLNLATIKDGRAYKYDGNQWEYSTVDKKGKIYDLYGDSKGNLWCATKKAIYKYESNDWKEVQQNESGLSAYISIFEDSKGSLWFGLGSPKGRLERYIPE